MRLRKRAGMSSATPRRHRFLQFASCSHQNVENVIAFHLIDTLRLVIARTLFLWRGSWRGCLCVRDSRDLW